MSIRRILAGGSGGRKNGDGFPCFSAPFFIARILTM